MAIGVDTSKWKPRQLKGTPAFKARDICSFAVISVGFLIGAFYQFSGVTSKFRKAFDVLYEDPIEEVERKQLIASGLPFATGDGIRKLVEESKRIDVPDK